MRLCLIIIIIKCGIQTVDTYLVLWLLAPERPERLYIVHVPIDENHLKGCCAVLWSPISLFAWPDNQPGSCEVIPNSNLVYNVRTTSTLTCNVAFRISPAMSMADCQLINWKPTNKPDSEFQFVCDFLISLPHVSVVFVAFSVEICCWCQSQWVSGLDHLSSSPAPHSSRRWLVCPVTNDRAKQKDTHQKH